VSWGLPLPDIELAFLSDSVLGIMLEKLKTAVSEYNKPLNWLILSKITANVHILGQLAVLYDDNWVFQWSVC